MKISSSSHALVRHQRKFFVAAGLATAIAATIQLAAPPAPVSAAVAPASLTAQMPESFADLVKAVKPAVVNIATAAHIDEGGHAGVPEFRFPEGSPFDRYFREFFEHRNPGRPKGAPVPNARSMGSGFIIDPAGYVVTNNHVVDKAVEITVTLNDGEQLSARLIGRDVKTDIALLKIDADEPLPHVSFGDSDTAEVGDWVIAVGNPFGLGGSVSAGIISARGRDIRSGPFDDFLQIDAPINRGSSGGPLFDKRGQVIGINTAIFSPSGGNIGIGFAIPSSMAESIVTALREDGHVARGWLGVNIQEITEEIAESLDIDEAEGALIAGVMPGGPAEAAGLRTGDVILEFGGEEVERVKDLPRLVAATKANKTVTVRVLRDGEEKDIRVEVGAMPEDEVAAANPADPETPDAAKLGLALAPLTPEFRQRLRLADDVSGVVIADVARNSPAAREGLRPGDLIKRVGSREVNTPGEVIDEVKRHADRKAVLLLISRAGNDRFIAVPLDKA
jgi:serine protease Do